MGCRPNDNDPAEARSTRSLRGETPPRGRSLAGFEAEVRRDLAPRATGPLGRLMLDHVALAAGRLREAVDARALADADLASTSLRSALDAFDAIRARPTPTVDFEDLDDDAIVYEPNEWPVVPSDDFEEIADESEPEAETAEVPIPDWRDRLAFDLDVSDVSPVVKGTWITASHVVSLIVDGWTWADILRAHPELTEDDIRTCVNYTIFEEGTRD